MDMRVPKPRFPAAAQTTRRPERAPTGPASHSRPGGSDPLGDARRAGSTGAEMPSDTAASGPAGAEGRSRSDGQGGERRGHPPSMRLWVSSVHPSAEGQQVGRLARSL